MSKKDKKPSIVKVKVADSPGPPGQSGTCHCSN